MSLQKCETFRMSRLSCIQKKKKERNRACSKNDQEQEREALSRAVARQRMRRYPRVKKTLRHFLPKRKIVAAVFFFFLSYNFLHKNNKRAWLSYSTNGPFSLSLSRLISAMAKQTPNMTVTPESSPLSHNASRLFAWHSCFLGIAKMPEEEGRKK